jgi:hypothetical protein
MEESVQKILNRDSGFFHLEHTTNMIQQGTKELAQEAIINKFAEAYASNCGDYLENISSRERPDFEATINQTGERIGIEVTGLYQNQREAMINYNKIPEWETFTGSLDEIVSSLNIRLEKKAALSSKYEFDGRLLLAIWAGSMIYNQPIDFEFILDKIKVPSSNFDQIWLLLEDKKGKPTLLLLPPPKKAVNLHRIAFWVTGLLVMAVILVLLIRPEMAGSLTMALLLLAAVLGAIWWRDSRN